MKIKRGLGLLVLKITASAVLLALLSRKISWADAFGYFRILDVFMGAAATVALGVSHWLCAFRWHLVSHKEIPLGMCVRYTWISQIYALILPGALSADLAKGLVMATSKRGKTGAVVPASILMDRLSGLGMLFLCGEVACLFVDPIREKTEGWIWLAIFVSVPGLLFFPIILRGFCRFLAGVGTLARMRQWTGEFMLSLDKLDLRTWLRALFISLTIHGVNVTFYWLCMKAVHLGESWWLIGVYSCVLNLAMLLPISIGGIGVREYLSTLMFAAGTAAAGVAFSWLVLLVTVLHGLVGLVLQMLPAKTVTEVPSGRAEA